MKSKILTFILILFILNSCNRLNSREEYKKYHLLMDFIDSISKNYLDYMKILTTEKNINTKLILDKYESKKNFQNEYEILKLHDRFGYRFSEIYENRFEGGEIQITLVYMISEMEFEKIEKIEETRLDKNPSINDFNISYTFSIRNEEYYFRRISVRQHFPVGWLD